MSRPFVPLLPAPAPNPPASVARVRIVTDAHARSAFQPMAIAKEGEPARTAQSPGEPPPAHAPEPIQVELQQEGERIKSIQIRCRCGQIIHLDCDYEDKFLPNQT